jgi:hypothetical protein
MAQMVSRWPLTAEVWVSAQMILYGICGGRSGIGQGFSSSSTVFLLLVIIPSLLHIHLPPLHEVCNSSGQAAHYHTLFAEVIVSSNIIV